MLIHKGTQELHTPSLTLRAVNENDYIEMCDSFASDKEVLGELALSCEKEKEFCNKIINSYDRQDCYYWLVCDKASKEILGAISVQNYNKDNDSAELGYCLAKKHWGKSIIPDALSMVIWYLFTEIGFNKLYLKIITENTRSIRVAHKCGFTKDGILKEEVIQNGIYKNMAIYSITRKMFDKYLQD